MVDCILNYFGNYRQPEPPLPRPPHRGAVVLPEPPRLTLAQRIVIPMIEPAAIGLTVVLAAGFAPESLVGAIGTLAGFAIVAAIASRSMQKVSQTTKLLTVQVLLASASVTFTTKFLGTNALVGLGTIATIAGISLSGAIASMSSIQAIIATVGASTASAAGSFVAHVAGITAGAGVALAAGALAGAKAL